MNEASQEPFIALTPSVPLNTQRIVGIDADHPAPLRVQRPQPACIHLRDAGASGDPIVSRRFAYVNSVWRDVGESLRLFLGGRPCQQQIALAGVGIDGDAGGAVAGNV